MSNYTPSSAVYTILIKDKAHRRPLPNPYTLVSSIEKAIKQEFKIDYPFDLIYKGAFLPSNVPFMDLRIESAEPLRIRRKSTPIEDVCSTTQPIPASEIHTIETTSSPVERKICSERHNTEVMLDAWTDQHCWSTQVLKDNRLNQVDTPKEHHRVDRFGIDSNDGQLTTVKVTSLTHLYNRYVPMTATFQDLWHSIDDICKNDEPSFEIEKVFPLFFNNRMHIFNGINIRNETLKSFLRVRASLIVERQMSDFYIYFLSQTESDSMYTYQQDPNDIFTHSHWWIPRAFQFAQHPIAQSMLLSSLYALRKYFRQPSKDEIHQRQQFESKFLIICQQYMFPPTLMALVHALQGKMFAFEKAILADGLLFLLSEFCPEDIEPSMLGTFMPNLICSLFEQCENIDTQVLPCINYDLHCCVNDEENHYNDRIEAKNSLNEDSPMLCEQFLVSDEKQLLNKLDLYSFVKHLKRNSRYFSRTHYNTRTYMVTRQINVPSFDSKKRLTHPHLMELFDMMVVKYPMFALKTRKDVHNNIQDQLVLLRDKYICVLLAQESEYRKATRINKIMYLFDPTQSRDCITNKDFYDIHRDGTNINPLHGLLQSWLRAYRLQPDSGLVSTRAIDQITFVLLDVGESMFNPYLEKNDSSTLMRTILSMLNILVENLESPYYEHAFGLVEFGAHIKIVCPITQDSDRFEKGIANITSQKQSSSRLYEAIQTGIDCILRYQRENCEVNSKPDKLIICISNGINSKGNVNPRDLSYSAKKAKIRIDLISFLPDPRLLKTV